MPGELTLEQLLMQGMATDAPSDVEQDKDDVVETPAQKAEEDIDINSLLAQELETDDEDTPEEGEDTKGEDSKDNQSGTPDSSKSKDTEESSQVPFPLAFARYQLEQGILTELNEEELLEVYEKEGDAAAISYLQNKELEKARNELLDTYEDDVKYYLEMLDAGVDRNTAKSLSQAKAYYENLGEGDIEDEEKEDLRKDVLTQYYKLTTKFSDAKIKKEIENKIALGEDIEFAKEALPEIRDYFKQAGEAEKKKIAEDEASRIKQAQERMNELTNKIEGTEEIIPSIKLSKGEKNRLKEMLTKPVKEVNGVPLNAVWAKRADDPDKFDTVLAALINYGVFDGKWDKITKTAKSKVAEDLENTIKSGGVNFKNKPGRPKANAPTDAIQASLEGLKSAFGNFGR